MFKRKKIGEMLIEAGHIGEKELNIALAEQKKRGKRIGQVLIELGYLTEDKLLPILGKQLKVPFVDLSKVEIKPEVLKMVPEKIARKHLLIPISFDGKSLMIGMADPLDVFIIDEIQFQNNCEVVRAICSENQILENLDKLYVAGAMAEALQGMSGDGQASASELDALKKASDDTPIIKLCNLILTQAVQKGASDIHIEPDEGELRVRLRIDGSLMVAMTLQPEAQASLVSRLKILASMDISERRIPQDGRIQMTIMDKPIDFRVNTIPVAYGEKVCLRILDKSNVQVDLDMMGFTPHNFEMVKKAIAAPNGMVLVTGPTGSGKTTTLYACLNAIKGVDVNICTVENPVEYKLKLINQVQVRPEIDLDFAKVLRAFLRQDPDVIMLGEIRDEETATIAVEAALTGHLVFATLHTNDAPSTASRLIDMGVEPFLVSAALLCVVSQRLARRICKFCKDVDTSITPEVLATLGLPPEAINNTYYRGKGCEKCGNTGYKGRVGVHEVMYTSETIRRLIIQKASGDDLMAAAIKNGMKTLKEDIVLKFTQGLTTPDEVFALCRSD
ncbi:MAG: Type IV fimbrial assembly, ATPase PilB [Candidatus Ozemobacter sibiricus]|jgi:type IV pilus assembly protein PilB|uniref:Type IV fimbrial assembly, ATPase PilB n=1 Tax=Candidatus Ozemobacter sibiricus TaxID=2268124 RepID=A0A367ZTR4_9BACT|nr:MAG: Type IV fimbrial assembly, ATPase PilB [Candidatus Ozemobacter sibiricus]